MKRNAVAVMGYPAKPNNHRFNSNRKTPSISNNKNSKEKRKE